MACSEATSFEKLVPQQVVITASTKIERVSGHINFAPYIPPPRRASAAARAAAAAASAPGALEPLPPAPPSCIPQLLSETPLQMELSEANAAVGSAPAAPEAASTSVSPPPLCPMIASRRWSGTRLTRTAVLRPTSASSS